MRKRTNLGQPPGTLILPIHEESREFRMTVINYGADHFNQVVTHNMDEALDFIETFNTTWIHLECVDDLSIFSKIGDTFAIHPVVLEDMLTPDQRPKMEDLGEHLFLVVRDLDPSSGILNEDPLSILLGPDYIITLQNSNRDIFSRIRERISANRGYVRQKKSDYLLYALLDLMIDNYFLVIDQLSDRIESLEIELLKDPSQGTLKRIYEIKNQVLVLQKSILPTREIMTNLRRTTSLLLDNKNGPFFADLADNTIQVMESTLTFREIVSNMYDMYISMQSNKMNQVMKVLTVIGTIFIPLTFITSLYGMNFKYMPELQFRYAYPVLIFSLVLIGVGMFLYFKRKKWF